VLDKSTLGDAADANPVIVWQELDYKIDCCVTKVGHIEHL
jgi:hypothetical protein